MSETQYVIVKEVKGPYSINVNNPTKKIIVRADVAVGGSTSTGTSSPPLEFEHTATVDGAQTLNIGIGFLSQGTALFINGLKQSRSSYSLSGVTVTLPSTLNIITGDVLTFSYFPA